MKALGSVALLLAPIGLAAQQTAYPGLPPDCWTEPRIYHSEQDYRWSERTTIERVESEAPAEGEYSPNKAYSFSRSGEPPESIVVLIFAEKDHLIRISFNDAISLNEIRWINEKLLYLRPWWGRIAATDIIYDVEKEEVVLAESATYGLILMEQAKESCRALGGCECVEKE
jgi:hypothetical protein